eukprot:gene17031-biopygen18847
MRPGACIRTAASGLWGGPQQFHAKIAHGILDPPRKEKRKRARTGRGPDAVQDMSKKCTRTGRGPDACPPREGGAPDTIPSAKTRRATRRPMGRGARSNVQVVQGWYRRSVLSPGPRVVAIVSCVTAPLSTAAVRVAARVHNDWPDL